MLDIKSFIQIFKFTVAIMKKLQQITFKERLLSQAGHVVQVKERNVYRIFIFKYQQTETAFTKKLLHIAC